MFYLFLMQKAEDMNLLILRKMDDEERFAVQRNFLFRDKSVPCEERIIFKRNGTKYTNKLYFSFFENICDRCYLIVACMEVYHFM